MPLHDPKKRLVREFYKDKAAKTVFQNSHLDNFDKLWSLDAPWFEAPNERRSGFSGVVTWEFIGQHGEIWPVFIKRQHNHNTRTWRHPLTGIPTFYREYQNITNLIKLGVPTIDTLYYGEQATADGVKAILVSRALDGYVSLEDWFKSSAEKDELVIAAVLKQIVAAIKPMHQHRIRHGCLYGKHIFIKFLPDNTSMASGAEPIVDVRLLDLEKAHVSLFKKQLILKDLSQLIRHTSPEFYRYVNDLLLFYFGEAKQQYWLLQVNKQVQKKTKS